MKKPLLIFSVLCIYFISGFAQAGHLDSSFGTNGIVKTDFGLVNDNTYASTGRQVLLQNDENLYILIESSGQSYITKRRKNGSADISYGNNSFSQPLHISQAVAASQADGKIVIAGIDDNFNFTVARFNNNGTVDNTFNGGMQTTDFGSGFNIATAIAVQADGKIVVAGYANTGSSTSFAVSRYNTNGTADSTFSTDGTQTTDFDSEVNYAYSIAIQSDGKIVVAGQTFSSSSSDFAIARYNSNGSLDNSFSQDGRQTTDFDFSDDAGKSVAIQKDGKIVVTGNVNTCTAGTCGDVQLAIVRYHTNGTLDNTFSEDGKQIINFISGYFATSLAIQGDEKIVTAGYAFDNGNADFAFARLDANGTLDNTFADNGKLTTNFNGDDFAYSVALQRDGKIVAAGLDYGDNFDVARYNNNGTLDATFGREGKLSEQLRLNQGSTYYTSTALQNDGKLVTAGYTWNGDQYDFAVARYNPDGTPDSTFSNDGRQIADFTSADDYAYTVAILKDGKIILAGSAGSDFALIKYNTDGSPDKTFGINGKKTTSLGVGNTSVINTIVVQSDQKIVVAGYAYGTGYANEDFVLARYNTDGNPDKTFSGDGILTTDLGFSDVANAAVIQKDGKIVAGGYSSVNNRGESSSFFALVRYTATGALDNTFSDDGKQFTAVNQFGSANALAIQDDGKIVAAGFSSVDETSGQSFAVARYNNDGSLDAAFNNGGTQITDLASESESANAVVIQNDGKILAGGISDGNFAIARYNTDGTSDQSFNQDGYVITEASGSEDAINDLIIDKNEVYGVGYGEFPGNLGLIAKYYLKNENKTPAVHLTIPANIVKYTGPAKVKLLAAVTDNNSKIKKVQFYNGTALLHTEDIYPYGFLWTDVATGRYTLTAKAFDGAGQIILSNSIDISVVNENVPPVVSMATPVNDTAFTGPVNISLSANAKDANDKISKVEFYNGSDLLKIQYIYPYSFTWTNVQPGTYTITAKATDEKGLLAVSDPVTIAVTEPNTLVEKRGLNSKKDVLSIKLSPNPTGKNLQVYTGALPVQNPFILSVMSSSGVILKTISSGSSAKTINIDVSSLVPGIYYIKAMSGNKTIFKPFVKF